MEFNKYSDVDEYASAALSHSSTNSNFFTLLALRDGRLRPEELDPRRRGELREAVLWEMEKERKRSEIIEEHIAEFRTTTSSSVQKATATAVRFAAEEEIRGMSLEERLGRRAAARRGIREFGTAPFGGY